MQAAGAMIRQLRTERNYSQAGLAHGICAASYLSKIEQGQAEPSPEILDRLFQALGVNYCRDANLLSQAEEQLELYFEARAREMDTKAAVQWLSGHTERLIYSDLCLTVQIWRIYDALDRQDRTTAVSRRDLLEGLQPQMTAEQQYRYLDVCAALSDDAETSLVILRRAEQKKPCAMSRYQIAGALYHLGQYSQCIEAADQAYRMAAEEGDLYVLVWASFLLGSCYTDRDLNFAEKYYRRAIRLGSHLEARLENWAAYNLGASYLEWGKLDKALYWLARTKPVENGAKHNLLTAQKQSILFSQLGRREEAEAALLQAEALLSSVRDNTETWMYELYVDMVRFTRLFWTGDRGSDYEELLQKIYDQAGTKLGFGFRRFYSRYLIELYRSQRRYKDALRITEEIQEQFS